MYILTESESNQNCDISKEINTIRIDILSVKFNNLTVKNSVFGQSGFNKYFIIFVDSDAFSQEKGGVPAGTRYFKSTASCTA